jgi:hypothetical protein
MPAINSPQALQAFALTTLDFEDIAHLDQLEFAFGAGQPYQASGLGLHYCSVNATANMNSTSGHVGVKSGTVWVNGNSNLIELDFSIPQKAVGFYYRDVLGTTFKVQIFDPNQVLLEENTFPVPEGYAGFRRGKAEIGRVVILSPHNTPDEAYGSRTNIDDLSFSTTWMWRLRPHLFPIMRWAWLWLIFAGYILITPIGPICIVCDSPLSSGVTRALGILTLLLGGLGALMSSAGRQR